MNPHLIKVVPVNGLVLGQCRRAVCKTCGWMGGLRPLYSHGVLAAERMANQDGEKHIKECALTLAMPDFMIKLNENPEVLVEEPTWRK